MPSLDHAVFLINTVKFHCGQLFHLFDEETFMAYLHEFYADPSSHIAAADLPYIHLLLILAFGKAFAENNNYQAKRPPGADYFVTALRLLPSIHILVYEPLISTEILCCIALYFESLDYRHSSHGFINLETALLNAAAGYGGLWVYGANGRLNKKFLLSTKKVLENIAGLADELQQQFPLGADKAINGVSRCIVLATRPLLLCFLKIRFETPDSITEALNSSQTVWNLIKMCIDSSYQMINILGCLQSQGLLEAFLPFDLESLFVSSFNLLIAPVLDPRFSEYDATFRHKTHIIFNEMISKGNLIAMFRRSELQQLDDMLGRLPREQSDTTPIPIDGQIIGGTIGEGEGEGGLNDLNDDNETMASMLPGMDDLGMDAWFTTAQMIDMANSIANSDTEFLSHTMMEHDIW
ncbi:hypothetical protein BFJ68_g14902 [Fusarium oxysporum]|uniref:Transcription factor domain-containing protein n=1 Tax=Fusarium oxysporum TaxID=5507 RepID=A0A420PRP8_FUSOX|nr:hypothetical protein BFJ68_g14902 [Fusarium oxysporum]